MKPKDLQNVLLLQKLLQDVANLFGCEIVSSSFGDNGNVYLDLRVYLSDRPHRAVAAEVEQMRLTLGLES